MKKRAIAIVIIWALFLCFVWQFRTESYADPFTASQIASTTFALMQDWGMAFTAGNATASGMNDFLSGQVEDYVNAQGGSIADVFLGQIAVDAAGKLVVGQQMYNSIATFVGWLKNKFDAGTSTLTFSEGNVGGTFIPSGQLDGSVDIDPDGVSVFFTIERAKGFGKIEIFWKGSSVYSFTQSSPGAYYGTYNLAFESDSLYGYFPGVNAYGTQFNARIVIARFPQSERTDKLSANLDNYVEPTVLNPDKEWTGFIGGYSVPDINLEDLLDGIDESVADNNLDVDGEIIDVPIPPSPQPTVAPDIPLSDVPWEGLNDLIDNTTDSISESIGEAASDITGAIEGTQEAVESLEQSITESLDVPAAEDITGRKFDLSTLFPFCIPFDIYRMLQAFDGTPEAPHVQLPFVIQSIGFSYTFDLDFSAFDSVAAIMRTAEFIAFGIFLAFSTSKVIRW